MPVRAIVTSAAEADCSQAENLVDGIDADVLIADKGYDTDKIEEMAQNRGMEVCIPPRKHRKKPRNYDEYLYKLRHLVENTIQRLKEWRGIATRYAKRQTSFYAAICLRCAIMWASIS
jgi:transposase